MEFGELEELKREIKSILEHQVQSMRNYHLDDFCGFRHIYELEKTKDDFSKASTATCVQSLIDTGCWTEGQPWWYCKTSTLLSELLKPEKWTSAKLPHKNPFTVAFILEAVLSLGGIRPDALSDLNTKQTISDAIEVLQKSLVKGRANLVDYPPSTYLTQLVVRVLQRCGKLYKKPREAVRTWAWRQIDHELVLIHGNSKSQDPVSLAYAVILAASCSDPSETTPDQKLILRKALDCVFDSQLPDGTWPRSRPLFHYPTVGNAYCFEYEMLTQLLQQGELRELSLKHFPRLKLATEYLKQTAYLFPNGGLGWASGHHPQLPGPESWSTASVYHFLYELDRTLAEAIRRSIFDYVGVEYVYRARTVGASSNFAEQVLDSNLVIEGKSYSLKKALYERFIQKVASHSELIEVGKSLPNFVPISAILFGPPGTAKTRWAREISLFLGWPLLAVDPSHLVRKGLDQVQAETNVVFSMLATAERIVVLLDEFDEMVRERKAAQSEVLSRFLTTAMLPKLALINDRRRIVFIVVTNHIDQLDFAIRRSGRFDIVVQVMPPNLKEKFRRWPQAQYKLSEFSIDCARGTEVAEKLTSLTYMEFEELSKNLETARNNDHAQKLIEDAHRRCALHQEVFGEGDKTWAQLCKEHRRFIRVPGL